MRQFIVYLAGPITGVSFDDSTDWREYVIKAMPREIIALSPLRGKTYLAEEKSIAADYVDIPLSCQRGITARDYNDVKRCDLLLVNLLGAKKVSIGTVMEIAWAKAFGIPIVLIMEKNSLNIHDHPMIKESADFWVEKIDDGIHLAKVILLPAPHREQRPLPQPSPVLLEGRDE